MYIHVLMIYTSKNSRSSGDIPQELHTLASVNDQ
jgi:hypothetical protein